MVGQKRKVSIINSSRVFICVIFYFSISSVTANTGISIGSGYGVAHIVPVRIGIQMEFEKHWNTETTWPISGYWEGSFYTLNGKPGIKPDSHKYLNAVALAGVFRFESKDKTAIGWPYAEIGVGLSWLSKKEIGGRELGLHVQFEDRVGLGTRFGSNRQYDINCKFIHFSNAYIGPRNNGINLYFLMLGYWF